MIIFSIRPYSVAASRAEVVTFYIGVEARLKVTPFAQAIELFVFDWPLHVLTGSIVPYNRVDYFRRMHT